MGGIVSSLVGGEGADEPAPQSGLSAGPVNVTTFRSKERWEEHLKAVNASGRLVVVDFSASWCGPCRFIEPAIKELARRYDQVEFVKIDVDELPEVAKAFHVDAMPTFVLIKGGKEVTRVIGANKDDLERNIAQYSTVHST